LSGVMQPLTILDRGANCSVETKVGGDQTGKEQGSDSYVGGCVAWASPPETILPQIL
jgi:hypothetical protein